MKDYFRTLGVDRAAGDTEIKSAYRLLVRRYHPDVNANASSDRFMEVQEAYEVLRDPLSRRDHLWDLERRPSPPPRAPPPPREDPMDPFSHLRRAAQADLRSQILDVEIERELGEKGGFFTTRIPVVTDCPSCGDRPIERRGCDLCQRSGRLRVRVRGTLRIPLGVQSGHSYPIECDLELFGSRVLRARIVLV